MNPKVAWDLVLAFAGGAGLIAGVAGFLIGYEAYEPYCIAVGLAGCTRPGGEIFGIDALWADSPTSAGFLFGAICAFVTAIAVGFYKERQEARKAAIGTPGAIKPQ